MVREVALAVLSLDTLAFMLGHGFCGSGMTGVAAQWCDIAPESYRRKVEVDWAEQGLRKPDWGVRRAVLGDLSPAATFIAAGYNLPFDVGAFAAAARKILDDAEHELGWMYETRHKGATGRINYAVWSEVFLCPECSGEVIFVNEALDKKTKRVHQEFPCPHCGANLNKDNLEQSFETLIDPATRMPWKRICFRPVQIDYSVGGRTCEKELDENDKKLLKRIADLPLPAEIPTDRFPIEEMYHGSRLAPKGFTHIHHLFLPRAIQALAVLWRKASAETNVRLRDALLFFVEQAIWGMSMLARYAPTHYSQVNQYLNGVYYVGSQIVEVSPWYILDGKLSRLVQAFSRTPQTTGAIISTSDCAALPLGASSIDYVFTDPPFGDNIFYADLNFLVESWHRVITEPAQEAIVDPPKRKGVHEYQDLMRRCFAKYYDVLKPGRWMTVVFSNSSNAIWRAIQEAIGTAGFVVADVRTLDKQQGSYRQITSSAVKQDLVISAYKPSSPLARVASLSIVTEDSAWSFVTEHLRNLPVLVSQSGEGEILVERTAQTLLDRMIAFHVQREIAVPLSAPDFLTGLASRCPERDGMYFLPDQVPEYDRKRTSVRELRQLSLFVNDEASAIQWLRQQLTKKPQTLQELTPQFLHEQREWLKHERPVELNELLKQNFLCYEGRGEVPSQIHSYLSSNFKELRNLGKDVPRLVEKALERWYVPDPSKLADREKLRQKALLREFEEYKTSKQRKLKVFRTEAVRAGFKAAYDARDYKTIVAVADKLPEQVLQEDEKLLMYYDVASMRLGDG